MGDLVDAMPGLPAEVIDLVDSESEDASRDSNIVSMQQKETCLSHVLSVFEDICPTHLAGLAEVHNHNAEVIVALIVDQQENGTPYPKRENNKKRKRGENSSPVVEESAAIRAKLHDPEYSRIMTTSRYKDMAVTLISQDYPKVPKNTIKNLLAEHGSSVFHTYTTMDEAARNWDNAAPRWTEKKTATKIDAKYSRQNIDELLHGDLSADEKAALKEFVAARRIREEHDTKAAAEAEENANRDSAILNGQVAECGCCLDDVPLNRVVQCDGRRLIRSVGPLTCMSMDGCQAGFSASQRQTFLDEKLQVALDRIEQQAMLEMAGIESLETCPFCPFAMEYPPVEENKEFRCANTDCEIVSCRLCRKVTHIPKTCAEAAAEEGHEARHTIEEAMSEAMIRRCNSCKNPFIKQDGCNKITCTRCRTIQCYVCRQTVKGYDHFNDASRGGKEGQCPLFDATEERHEAEVQRAQEEMRKKVEEENPDLENTALDIKVSNQVQEDDKKRKERDPRYHQEMRGGRHWPMNFLVGNAFAPPPVNAVPLRPGQANAPGPDAQARLANPPRQEVQIEQEDGGRQPQRLGHFRAMQRAQQQIAKQLDNRKRDLFARLAEQGPFARPAMPQGRQPADYQGGIPRHDLAPVPAAHQNNVNARAQLGRPPQHRYRPNDNHNSEGPKAALRPQGNGREQAQARPLVSAEAQPGLRRDLELAQRLLGNDYQVAAAADGRPPNHMLRRRDMNPNNVDLLQNRAARQEGPRDAFLLGGNGPGNIQLTERPSPLHTET
ncbi:E3 ubiquitin-protein ligase [Apiospora marii]|uniref:E3 ubiquitin-protein ligase n=1 Tax=Apiospora marii TaxID=335849 RepID=A0ABR1SAT7_9PEZI